MLQQHLCPKNTYVDFFLYGRIIFYNGTLKYLLLFHHLHSKTPIKFGNDQYNTADWIEIVSEHVPSQMHCLWELPELDFGVLAGQWWWSQK